VGQKWAGDVNPATAYNDTLRHLRDIDQKLAEESKMRFADVHGAMIDAMTKAKPVLGEDYDVCGRDGFHPGPNGHLAMAYAFLKALGCDGNVGTISIDMKAKATASDGHKVVNAEAGKVDLESTRYPFCFDGDAKSSGGTRSIAPFLPFNQDLNRLTLKVTNLGAAKAKVAWGAESKEFTREQLEAGINLAAEFERTPFDAAFQKVTQAIAIKQAYETTMIKGLVTQLRWLSQEFKDDPEVAAATAPLRKKLMSRQQKLEADVRAALTPVAHTILVTPGG
jgi:hypothetical protein